MVKLNQFMGLNNVMPPEQTRLEEWQVLKNAYVNDARRMRMRDGYQLVYGGNVHSIFCDDELVLFRESTALKMLNADNTATSLRSGLIGNQIMRYLALNELVYYTDGIVTGIIDNYTDRTWGLEVPTSPTLANYVGMLDDGRYQVTLTFVRSDGQESGALVANYVDVTDGGISITDIPVSADSDVSYVNVYISTRDGDTLFRALTIANGTTSATYGGNTEEFSAPLRTLHLSPPPAGHLIGFYNGRVYIAEGNILWWTEPWMYELVALDRNFIPFQSRLTLLAPVLNGIWVATEDETIFLLGDPAKPDDVQYQVKAKYGCIEGTQACITGQELSGGDGTLPNLAWLWTSTDGICMGAVDGLFQNVTDGRVNFPYSEIGHGHIRKHDDATLYLVSLPYANSTGMPIMTVSATGTGP